MLGKSNLNLLPPSYFTKRLQPVPKFPNQLERSRKAQSETLIPPSYSVKTKYQLVPIVKGCNRCKNFPSLTLIAKDLSTNTSASAPSLKLLHKKFHKFCIFFPNYVH